MLKRSAKFLATATGEETEQLTKEQEEALEDYLTKKQPWEPTGEAWIQQQYGVKKKEEVKEYEAFIQTISDYTHFLNVKINRWQRENQEKETTQETKAINKHIIDHALYLRRELEELPLEEQDSLTTPINKFLRANQIRRTGWRK